MAGQVSNPPKSRFRVFQFSLSTMLVVTLGIAAFIGGRLSRQGEIDQAKAETQQAIASAAQAQMVRKAPWPAPFKVSAATYIPRDNFVSLGVGSQLIPGQVIMATDADWPVEPESSKAGQEIPDEIERGMKAEELEHLERVDEQKRLPTTESLDDFRETRRF